MARVTRSGQFVRRNLHPSFEGTRRLGDDLDRRADADHAAQAQDVAVVDAHAAVRDGLAEQPRPVGAVDADDAAAGPVARASSTRSSRTRTRRGSRPSARTSTARRRARAASPSRARRRRPSSRAAAARPARARAGARSGRSRSPCRVGAIVAAPAGIQPVRPFGRPGMTIRYQVGSPVVVSVTLRRRSTNCGRYSRAELLEHRHAARRSVRGAARTATVQFSVPEPTTSNALRDRRAATRRRRAACAPGPKARSASSPATQASA